MKYYWSHQSCPLSSTISGRQKIRGTVLLTQFHFAIYSLYDSVTDTCLLFYHESHLIVRWLAIYFLFYLQALYVVIQRVVDPFFQVLERYSVQDSSCIADLEHGLYRAVKLTPGAVLVVFYSLYYAGLYRVLVVDASHHHVEYPRA